MAAKKVKGKKESPEKVAKESQLTEPSAKKAVLPKPGKVIRVDPVTWNFLTKNRKEKESVSAAVRRLLALPPKKGKAQEMQVYYILPESRIVCYSIEEARGQAILKAVKAGKDQPTEKPIRVKAIND